VAESLPQRLIVMALDIESGGLFEKHGVPCCTRLGKINAAIALTGGSRPIGNAGRQRRRSSISALPGAADLSPARSSAVTVSFSETWIAALGFAYGVTPFEDIPRNCSFRGF